MNRLAVVTLCLSISLMGIWANTLAKGKPYKEFQIGVSGLNAEIKDAKLIVTSITPKTPAVEASKVGDELIIDIEHYRRHPKAEHLWCVIYDPQLLIPNPKGLSTDLEGHRRTADGSIQVKVFIFGGSM